MMLISHILALCACLAAFFGVRTRTGAAILPSLVLIDTTLAPCGAGFQACTAVADAWHR